MKKYLSWHTERTSGGSFSFPSEEDKMDSFGCKISASLKMQFFLNPNMNKGSRILIHIYNTSTIDAK